MAIPRGSYKEKEKGAVNNVPKRKHKENTKKNTKKTGIYLRELTCNSKEVPVNKKRKKNS
jgi:hypothetical protein